MGDLDGRAHGAFGRPAWAWLLALMAAAAIARVLARLPGGEDAFLTEGYTFYPQVARQFLEGHGFCYGPGESCAVRTPLYSLFLAALLATGHLYPWVVAAQAAMGAATVWLAWRLGAALYGPAVGLVAAAATAFNPYALMHDAALQDTVLAGLLMLLAVVLLVDADRRGRARAWLGGGAALGLAILTTARVVLFAPCAVAWAFAIPPHRRSARVLRAALVAVPVLLLAGGWVARNWRVVGAPMLTTEIGDALYFGNGPLTFLHYPRESMDLTSDEFSRLPNAMQDALEATSGHDVARARLLQGWATEWILAHPLQAVAGAARKVWVATSAELSPAHGPLAQWGYRLLFLPVHVFAALAWWRARHAGSAHALTALVVGSFVVTTAVFYAHTSHKSYLDPLLFVYAAAFVTGDPPRVVEG